jgi:hypothetical protein
MSINSIALEKEANKLAKAMTPKLNPNCVDQQDKTMSQDLAEIVKTHALGAAASGVGVAWLPGVGSAAALAAMVGFIWSMYFRINYRLGLKFSKVAMKSLASAVLSNLMQSAISVVGSVALATVLSFTGIGNAASSLIMAALDYSVVMVGGILYLKMLNGLMGAGNDPSEMTPREIEIRMDDVMRGENIEALLKNESRSYKAGRKNGTITGKETVDVAH